MKKTEQVLIKKLYNDVVIPQYATEDSAGFDLIVHNFKKLYPAAHLPDIEKYLEGEKQAHYTMPPITEGNGVLIPSMGRLLVGCGFALEIPKGKELQIRIRSGVALKEGIVVLNSPGTIDADYRGEIGAILCNTSVYSVTISKGDIIAQGVLKDYYAVYFREVDELSKTGRGTGGFGSTDKGIVDGKGIL